MALVLDLEYSQSNDGKTITLTDSAGTYNNPDNTDGWGDPNPRSGFIIADHVVASTDTTDYGAGTERYHLLLDVTMTDKNGLVTTFDQINLYDHNGGAFATAAELTWDFTIDHFLVSTVATMTDNEGDRITDGIFEITYQVVENHDHNEVAATITERVLVDGDVRFDVYNKLRQIPVYYDYEARDTSREVMEALFAYSMLQSLEASSAVAMTEELVNILWTLNKLVSDGSHYTW